MLLAWRLLRGGGRRDAGAQVLAVLAFAVCTGLLLLTLAVDLGLGHRQDRQGWTVPRPGGAGATAVESTHMEFYAARPVTVVTVTALSPAAPVPPGLDRFPAPGQSWLSPALAALVRADPALRGRWPGETGRPVGRAGLADPQQLLVVTGTDQAAPVTHDLRHPQAGSGPVRIAAFRSRSGPGVDETYRNLALIASVLLVVPLLVLGGGAARLGLARRDQRLAALRLVGASSRQIAAVVALESGSAAAAGAALGAVAYAAALPFAARVPIGGGVWFATDLWVGPGVLMAVLLATVLAGVLSALVTLRQVIVSPLGVAQRHAPRGRHLWRIAVFAAATAGYLKLSRGSDPSLVLLVVAFGIVFAALALVGPWVIVLLGRVLVATARRPARLLAGRRLLDEPKAAWRTVGGLALTGFVAGFLALFPSSSRPVGWGDPQVLNVAVPAGQAQQAQRAAQQAVTAAGLPGQVAVGPDPGALMFSTVEGNGTAYLSIPVRSSDRERARTAVSLALPGLPAATGADTAADDDLFASDVHRASTAVLTASFLVAMASAAITARASVLDRRRTYRLLHLAGTPLQLLDRARRIETTAPLLVLVLASVAAGLLCSAPLTRLGLGGGQINGAGLVLLTGTVAVGVAGVRAASAASRPLLRSVATDPASRAG